MARGKAIEAATEFLGAEHRGDAYDLRSQILETADKPMPTDAIELERFMQDKLTILVSEGNGDYDKPYVQVGVNGEMKYIPRGKECLVARKFVERLARAKPTHFEQNTDPALGEGVNVMRQRHLMSYPFTVIHDPAPNGLAWLRGVLAEVQ